MADKLFVDNKKLNDIKSKQSKCADLANSSSLKDFFDFLETAYLVQGCIDGTLANTPLKTQINWYDLANNSFVNGIADAMKNDSSVGKNLHPEMSIKISNKSDADGTNKMHSKIGMSSKRGEEGDAEYSQDLYPVDPQQQMNELLSQLAHQSSDADNKIKSQERRGSHDRRGSLGGRRKSVSNKKDTTSSSAQQPAQKKEGSKIFDSVIKQKLQEVLNEGLLDSILPYIAPSNFSLGNLRDILGKTLMQAVNSSKREANKKNVNASGDSGQATAASGGGKHSGVAGISGGGNNNRRRSSTTAAGDAARLGSEVEIHVCDESKGTTKDFRCPQRLLVQQMGYFADVQSGQKLEDMDISVHCDIRIFEWLMRWVKRDPDNEQDWPVLDAATVAPVLVSATFLRMEPLVHDCLIYCHGNLSEIIRCGTGNMSCLNDSIITRLAAMYTNAELEAVRDKRDRIQSRLFCKMICSLAEPEPETLRGHYASLQGLYRCVRCHKLIMHQVAHLVPCLGNAMRLDRWGDLICGHQRDPGWSLSQHVQQLHRELRSWRRVYWRLWGTCHSLGCSVCGEPAFPVSRLGWCRFHPEPAQFPGGAQCPSAAPPVGRHPCCAGKAYRYETLPRASGCEYREHYVQPSDERESAILRLYTDMSHVIAEDPPDRAPKEENVWWANLSIIPARTKSLVPVFQDTETMRQTKKSTMLRTQMSREISTDTPKKSANKIPAAASPSDSESDAERNNSAEVFSSSDLELDLDDAEDCESEENSRRKKTFFRRRGRSLYKRSARNYVGVWSEELSARSNQDNQREYEEKAMRQLISMLSRKNGIDTRAAAIRQAPAGGTYIKLENEWRDSQAQWSNGKTRKIKEKSKH